MTFFYIALVAALVAFAFWAVDRARRIKAAAHAREQQVLEAVAIARREGADAQSVDVDSVFGKPGAAKAELQRTARRADSTLPARDLGRATEPAGRTQPGIRAQPMQGHTTTPRPPTLASGSTAAIAPNAAGDGGMIDVPSKAGLIAQYEAEVQEAWRTQPRPQVSELEHFRRAPADKPASPPARAAVAAPAPLAERGRMSPAMPQQPESRPQHATPNADAAQLRELVLTWYEVRGYRPIPALPNERPIEYVFRHKADPLRAYAFALLDQPLDRDQARALLKAAQAMQVGRLLLACVQPVDQQLARDLWREGIRALDQAGIDRELAGTDADAAQKIRALAQRRAQRQPPSGATS